MAQHLKTRKKLSKHLLEMKFMKLSKDRIEKEQEEEDCRFMFYNQLPDEMKSSSKFIMEPSWMICENLESGRRSYKGMNPIIEKIIAMENDDKRFIPKIKEEDVDVTAEEMADFHHQESTLIENTAKKFNHLDGSSPPTSKRRKFMKPVDD